MYGFSQLSTMKACGLSGGIPGHYPIYQMETKTSSPVLEIKLFRDNRTFGFTNLATLIHSSASFAIDLPFKSLLTIRKKTDP